MGDIETDDFFSFLAVPPLVTLSTIMPVILPFLSICMVHCMIQMTRPLPGHAWDPDSKRQRLMYEDRVRRRKITRDYQTKREDWERQHELEMKAKAEEDRQDFESKKKDDAMQAAMH
jgi:hypothetical protein